MYLKKQYLHLEFICITAYFLIPPLLRQPSGTVFPTENSFSWNMLLSLFVSLILYFQIIPCKQKNNQSTLHIIMNSSYVLKTFGLLIVTAVCINMCMSCFFNFPSMPVNTSNANIPLLILSFFISSFYEEIMYRMYVPYCLESLIIPFKYKSFLVEVLPVVIFAFSHRYLGWAAVCNAFISGIFLRRCFIKSGTIFTGYISHFLYNVFMLVLQVIQ